MELKNKVALITGGNRGIGKAIAFTLAKKGVKVFICGRNEELLKKTCEEINGLQGKCAYFVCDVRDENKQIEMFNELIKKYGRLDICIPNAGRATLAKTTETTLEDWNMDIETNLTGLFITSREALKIMKKQNSGYIIPIISKAGKTAFLLRPSYNASKWGALGFTKAMALEAKDYNVKVTPILPASVDTDFQKGNPYGTDWMLKPQEIAEAVLYLLNTSEKCEVDELVLKTRYKSKK
ncbi:SDR family NAD(P)-dependent oxidoreductase [bacterium]|nr:SDR family NAD(P)-dependent oxidoreductase [bacterium]